MNIAKELESLLTEDWADRPEFDGVRIIATERDLGDVQQTTALIRWKSVGPFPEAPKSHRSVGLLLTLISPHLDLDRAGDELATLTIAVLDYLDTRYRHEDATAVAYANRLAFDIPLTVIASKD